MTVASQPVEATTTVTMGYSKLGLHLKKGPEFSGKINVVDIGFQDVVDDIDSCHWSTFKQTEATPQKER